MQTEETLNEELNNIINEGTTETSNYGSVGLEDMQGAAENKRTETPAAELVSTGKLETRGRHKKDCTCVKCEAKKASSTSTDSEAESKNSSAGLSVQSGNTASLSGKVTDSNPLDLSEFKKTEISTASAVPEEVNAAKYITGSLLLMLIDTVAPTVILKALSMASDKYKKIPHKKVRLSKEQREDLEPLANEAVKQITVNMSPIAAFFLCTSVIYASNIISSVED